MGMLAVIFSKGFHSKNLDIICDHFFPKAQALDLDARNTDNLFMLFAGPDRLSIGGAGLPAPDKFDY